MMRLKIYRIGLTLLFAVITASTAIQAHSTVSLYEACIDSADNYVKRELYSEAATCYRNALKANPGSPLNSKVFANLGTCLAETGDYPAALEAFEVALIREPRSSQIRISRAKTYLLMRDVASALDDLNEALSADPASTNALRLRAGIYLNQVELEKAINDYDALLALTPDDMFAWLDAGKCHSLKGDADAAIDNFSKALTIEKTTEGYILLGQELIKTGKLEEAATIVREGIENYPRTGEMYLLRGVLHNKMYRSEEALTDKKTALALGVDADIAERAIPSVKRSGK